MKQYLFLLFCLLAYTLNAQDIVIFKDNYYFKEIQKPIKSVKFSNDFAISATIESEEDLNIIRFFGKNIGSTNYIIRFLDGKKMMGAIRVVEDTRYLQKAIKKINSSIELSSYADGKVVLEGEFENSKERVRVLEILKKGTIDIENNLIDLTETKNPPLMIKAKLYIAEINNKIGDRYKSSLDLAKSVSAGEGKIAHTQISSILSESVQLTGGLITTANILGSNFNLSAVLNFLQEKSIARVLDETVLLLVEDRSVDFHAGGTVRIRTQSVTGDGTPTSEIRDLPYGLDIKLKANTILEQRYVNLDIETSTSQLDWINQVDGIPAMLERSVATNVVAESGKTIILSGLLKQEDRKSSAKVPILGDIPIVGTLFNSREFDSGNSELIFFITPYIVNLKDEPYTIKPNMENIKEFNFFEKNGSQSEYNKSKIEKNQEIPSSIKRLLNLE